MRAVIVGAVGSTEIAVKQLAATAGWSISGIVTLPPELGSRHSDYVDLAPLAEQSDARLHHCANSNDPETIEAVAAMEADYIFVIGWSQICREEFLAIRPGKIIGYHPTALPRLRGRAALPWTILLNEPITAGSLFWLGDDADNGDLLDQEFFHVAPDETAASLYQRHLEALDSMLVRTLSNLAEGREARRPQDERYATWAARRTEKDGLIDWTQDASSIARLVRAVGRPYPGAFTYLDGTKITIWQAQPVPGQERHHAGIGQIVSRVENSFAVQTGEGLLQVLEWSSETGRMPSMHGWLGDAKP